MGRAVSLHLNAGVSLIEILISLLLIALLLFGFDAVQVIALRQATVAYEVTVAMQQLNNMVERLTVTQQIDHAMLASWNQQNHLLLGQGAGHVMGYYPNFSLSLGWGASQQHLCQQNKIGRSGCLRIDVSL